MEPFIATIQMFGFNFAPRGWAFCNGQTISIAQNTALFSLIGTTYGGNGQTTFQLPNFQSRVPKHMGTGPGLPTYQIGQMGGTPVGQLTINTMPSHVHGADVNIGVSSAPVGTDEASGSVLTTTSGNFYGAASGVNGKYGSASITLNQTGAGAPFAMESPYLTVNFCIALVGIFPARN